MTPQQVIGKKGEELAQAYLQSQGYKIKETNWKFSHAEIDIIAEKEGVLIFVEVKTKTYTYYGEPEESVDAKKERLICDAAASYMVKNDYEWEFRFDIISILLTKDSHEMKHFEDAFFPGI
jgi:putative endonuclease